MRDNRIDKIKKHRSTVLFYLYNALEYARIVWYDKNWTGTVYVYSI